MRSLRGIASGLLLACCSLLFILGSIALSLAEGRVRAVPPSPSAPPASASPFPVTIYPPATQAIVSATPSSLPTLACVPPPGWVPFFVSYGDTLQALAERFGVSEEMLYSMNCLSSDMLIPGSMIYVPQAPTFTPIPCGPPPGWVQYVVQPGETLFRLSQAFGVDYRLLQRANCLGSSTLIYAGQRLWVPNVPTRTPWVTDTPIIIVIETPTLTATLTPSPTPTLPAPTATPISTSTSSPAPSSTPSPTPSSTATPSATPTPTLTPSSTPTATETPTPTLSPTP
jgi:LysM repeat protein